MTCSRCILLKLQAARCARRLSIAGGLSALGSACSLGADLQGSCKKLTRAIMSHMRTSSPSRLSSIEHDTGIQLGLLQYKPQMPEGQLPLVLAHPSCLKQLTMASRTASQVRCLNSVCIFKTAASPKSLDTRSGTAQLFTWRWRRPPQCCRRRFCCTHTSTLHTFCSPAARYRPWLR